MNAEELRDWMRKRKVGEVSCLVPDMTGAARGKSLTPSLFIEGFENDSLRIPEAAYTINVQGGTVFNQHVDQTERDLVLKPDLSTLHLAPWNKDSTACMICDTVYDDDTTCPIAPRQILRKVIELYQSNGWKPIVGAEVEFYLIAEYADGALEPKVPVGASGQREHGQHIYSLDAIDEFDDLFEDLYSFCEIQNIELDTLIHEDGPCQFEVSLRHGGALEIADQLYLFKRLSRHVAKRHGVLVTFMAKPYANCSGSAIHLHQSVIDTSTEQNVFADTQGNDTPVFGNYLGGLQNYLPEVMPLMAPYTNSYNRFEAYMSAPTNTHWSRENRTVGLRVPKAQARARRVENRIPGADVNPYLAIAASLLSGFAGIDKGIEARPEWIGQGYDAGSEARALPSTLSEAVTRFHASDMLGEYIGIPFIETYTNIKRTEYDHRSSVLSPWDIRYLLVNI